MAKEPGEPNLDTRQNELDYRDKQKEMATDVEKYIAETQAAGFEAALYKLMNKGRGNVGLVNQELLGAIQSFVSAIDSQASAEEPLDEDRVKELVEFFQKKNYELQDLELKNKAKRKKPEKK